MELEVLRSGVNHKPKEMQKIIFRPSLVSVPSTPAITYPWAKLGSTLNT